MESYTERIKREKKEKQLKDRGIPISQPEENENEEEEKDEQ